MAAMPKGKLGSLTVFLVMLVVASGASGETTPGEITLAEYLAMSEAQQRGMVIGFLGSVDISEVTCQRPGTVSEYMAALRSHVPPHDPQRPWAAVMVSLLDERGCRGGSSEKSNV